MKLHSVFQNSLAIASAIGLGLLVSAPADAATFTLDRSLIGDTISGVGIVSTAIGTITTDGTLGLLSASNFVDWNVELRQFNFVGTLTNSIVLTPNNSTVAFRTLSAGVLRGDIQISATTSGILAAEVGSFPQFSEIFTIAGIGSTFASYELSGFDIPGGTFTGQNCSPAQQGTQNCLAESISISGSGRLNYVPIPTAGLLVATASNPTNVPEPSSVVSLLSLGALAAIGLGKKKA